MPDVGARLENVLTPRCLTFQAERERKHGVAFEENLTHAQIASKVLARYKACCRCKISISDKEIARRIAVKITPSCCLSEKWRITNLLDDIWMLLPRSNLWEKLEEGHSVTSVAAEFGIAHSIVSRLWRQFQTTGTAIRGFSSGRPRGTTPADDRYIVLQARRNRQQTAGEIARHTTQATGRPISRFTVARRLHGGGLFARRPVRCVPVTPAHRRRRSLWCREHRNWRDNEWGRVLFTDESRFSLSSDSHRYSSGESGEAAIIPRASLKGTGRRLAARTLPPVTIRELRLALQDEWAAMPQQLIDTLILSMGRRCETCLAVRRDHIPY
ncbi:transposable element Tcb2 transposase [Trichonephila clavipes]|nr:transposable element Tcb2 transposase [Trichonephila clavipes]